MSRNKVIINEFSDYLCLEESPVEIDDKFFYHPEDTEWNEHPNGKFTKIIYFVNESKGMFSIAISYDEFEDAQ